MMILVESWLAASLLFGAVWALLGWLLDERRGDPKIAPDAQAAAEEEKEEDAA